LTYSHQRQGLLGTRHVRAVDTHKAGKLVVAARLKAVYETIILRGCAKKFRKARSDASLRRSPYLFCMIDNEARF
jgi:hypothetical protein